MKKILRCSSWLLMLLLVLGSCRGSRAAYELPTTAPMPAQHSSPTSSFTATVPVVEPAPVRTPVAQPARRVSSVARVPRTAQPQRVSVTPTKLLKRLAPRPASGAAANRPQKPAGRDGFHLGLGIALIVGGVVAGLLLGGWLGLGVGAVIVLAGYYFLILGIGGPDAWLEIGQEFFNM